MIHVAPMYRLSCIWGIKGWEVFIFGGKGLGSSLGSRGFLVVELRLPG